MLTVHLDSDAAAWLLARLQAANEGLPSSLIPKNAVLVETALTAALSAASAPHNPHEDFGHTEGLPAASDKEAVDSLK